MMPSDEVERMQIDEFVDLKGKKVLEVGCGDGRLTAFLSRKTERLTAVDTDENRLGTARNCVKGTDFCICSGEALAFPGRSFDMVFFGFSLHHQDGYTALAEAKRVLKPGGDILIIEPTIMSEYTQLVAIFEKEEPALLARAQRAIASFHNSVSRREIFIVPHYFDTEERFLNHYITAYGGGAALEKDRQGLRRIIGQKRLNTPICIADECEIMLIPG